MRKINSIEELTEGQEVYIKAMYVEFDNDKYPVHLTYNTYGDTLILTKDFYDDSDDINTQIELFTAEPVGNSEQLVLPEIGKEYEFSYDGVKWMKDTICYYGLKDHGVFQGTLIKPIQQSQEELKAIELLKSLGYNIHK